MTNEIAFAALAAAARAEKKIPGAVSAWLEENVDPETGYVLDSSLTVAGAAADAKAAGDAVGELKSDIDDITGPTYNLIAGKLVGKSIASNGYIINDTINVWYAPVEANKTYTVKTDDARLVCAFYSSIPEYQSQSYNSGRTVQVSKTITAPIDGYIAFRAGASFEQGQVVEGNTDKPYVTPLTAVDSLARAGVAELEANLATRKDIKSDAAITTETPSAPYNDIHTLPLNSIVSYFASVSNVANTPNGKQGTAMTFYCGDSTVVCQLYVERDGTVYSCVKWGSTWGNWRLLYSPVEQTTGSSATAVMSQKAVTDAINAVALPEYEYTSVSLFSNIGVVGDSYSSGGILNAEGTGIVNCYSISWPQILGRKKGIDVKNYSSTGADIARFLTPYAQSTWNIDILENDPAKDLYVIVMGINTEKSLSDSSVTVAVGTVSDINKTDYTQNADTFCGHYGQMLTRIITHAPTAKIILVIPPTGTEKSEAISDIAELYGLPVFRMYDDAYYSTDFYTSNKQIGHPTAPSYAGMANAFDRQIAKCIVDNVSYFTDYRPQA